MTGRPINPDTKTWYTNEQLTKLIAEHRNIASDFMQLKMQRDGLISNNVELRGTIEKMLTAPKEKETVTITHTLIKPRYWLEAFTFTCLMVVTFGMFVHEGPPLYQTAWDFFSSLVISSCATGGQ